MIQLIRIDERFIHGQVAITWSKDYDITAIVVANDGAASNPIMKKTLKMAAPAGIKVTIQTVAEAIELLKDPRCEPMKILIIVNHPKDANRILQEIKVPFVNVGNFGRINKGSDKIQLNENLYVNADEFKEMKKLCEHGIKVDTRVVPSSPNVKLKDLLKERENEW